MTNLKRDLIEAIVLGLVIGAIGILGIVQYQQTKANDTATIGALTSLKNDINTLQDEIIYAENYNNFMFTVMNSTDNIILGTQQGLIKAVENLPNKIKYDKFQLEQKLKQVNVEIENATLGVLGSGVSIKYKGEYYILSAGHMATVGAKEIILLKENGNTICELEIVKHSYITPEEDSETGDATKGEDLLLLKPKDWDVQPRFYVELADVEPVTGTEVYVVGNPLGIEDVISNGRNIVYHNNFMYYIDHTYYGNSGGGVYSQDSKLIGIVSHMLPLQPNRFVPPYMIYGAVRLSVIYDFLAEIPLQVGE